MSEVITLPYKFTARGYQMPAINAVLNKGIRNVMLVWHRRAGKDKADWNILISQALTRVGNYFYVFPEIGQGRKAIWLGIDKSGMAFLDHIPADLIKRKNSTEMRLELVNGSTIQFVGANRYDNLVGTACCGMVFSEYAIQNPMALELLKPCLNENKGWLLINTTPRGHNHAYKLYQKAKDNPLWHTELLTVLDTYDETGERIVTDEMIEEDKTILSVERIRQEYFCDWDVALENAYFARCLRKAEEDGRIADFDFDASLPVHTFWDLGVADSMAIWFVQFDKNRIYLIDYYEDNGEGFIHYFNYLKDWRDKIGATFGSHYAPHDIQVRNMGAHAVRRLDIARQIGLDFERVPCPKSVQDEIEISRVKFNRVYFNKTKVQFGLDCLMEYHAKILPSGVPGGPEHNWASHCADAFMLISQAQELNLIHVKGGRDMTIRMNSYAQESAFR